MKTHLLTLAALTLAMAIPTDMEAQGIGSLRNQPRNGGNSGPVSRHHTTSERASSSPSRTMHHSSNVYYVSPNGSGRASGTIDSPLKDIQKAIDKAENGDVILIAAGNYLGSLDQGFIEVKKYLTIQGGYSDDFSEWDPTVYKTVIQPGPDCAGTNGNYGLFDLTVTGNVNETLIIDGISFDKGEENLYCAYNPKDPIASSPEGCLTGRMLKAGESPRGGKVGGGDVNKALMYGRVEGHLIVRNCAFVNGNNFAIQVSCVRGHFDIYNNVFCANVMSALESRGMCADMRQCSLSFHHNTVLFTWPRTKVLDDMGQGFRFMPGYYREDVHDNIFGCNMLGAIERTHFDSNAKVEAERQTSVCNNAFFMNHADLILPSGGGKWLYVKARNFEDVDEKYLTTVEHNYELQNEPGFIHAIDQAYLKGFAGLKSISSQSYDPNSSANQFNRTFGFNQQGTETVRPTMFANKYPFLKAFDLFGAVRGVGAQKPMKE